MRVLTELLELASPLAFGRASRVKQLALELAEALVLPETWQLEVAAMLSQLGLVALPHEVLEKQHQGQALSEAEAAMAARAPALTEQLLAHIPRLEGVREILAACGKPPEQRHPLAPPPGEKKQTLARSAQILRLAVDFDALEEQGHTPALILGTLRGRSERYDPQVLAALVRTQRASPAAQQIRELPVAALRVGMVLLDDLKLATGALMAARGFEVNESFVERARNFRPGAVREPIRVLVRATAATAP